MLHNGGMAGLRRGDDTSANQSLKSLGLRRARFYADAFLQPELVECLGL
jgi:hypothetical protein